MRINVVGKHMEVTGAIKTYAEGKCGKLTNHFDGVQQITVRAEQQPHNKGFLAEVVCEVVKHEDFVGKAEHADLYAAIDEAVTKVDRQIVAFKEKLKTNKHHAS
jgi:putative sigma-54 modulation protein